jgi:lipoprotein-anchoring transpeptidase ErfK/SrfK
LGLVKGQEGALKEALKSYQQAAQILPNAPEAPRKIKEVSFLLTPPTPTPTATPATPPTPTPLPKPKKRVEVDISEQRAYVYEGDKLVYKFVVSTGEPGRDTAIGQFEILNKIPMAYASTWNLDMPYWLGIYWSGSLQNGFHALPTVRHTGQMMWDGYLGQRVSYGCIILSYYDAKTLYNWVDIGTPVVIRN